MIAKYKDFAAGLFLLLLGLFLFISSQSIPSGAELSIGPSFMPKLMSLLLAVAGCANAAQGWFLSKRGRQQPETESVPNYKAVLLSLFYLLAYVLLLTHVGFLIMTALYIFLQTLLFAPKEKRNYPLFAAISIIATVLIYLIFVHVFVLILPAGILG